MTSVTIEPGGALRGTVRVPGDKSISHRALLMGALAEGTSTISGISHGHDVQATRAAVEACGASITDNAGVLTVVGGRGLLHEPEQVIDLGNAGTGMRLFAGWAASFPWLSILTGDASLRGRDMWRVVEPLRAMGAHIEGRHQGRYAPLAIRGGALHGITYHSKPGTAQQKSAVMLAALSAEGETTIFESVPARAHTEEMLRQFGATISTTNFDSATVQTKVAPSTLSPFVIDIPCDPSAAAFWAVAAAIVPGSEVCIENVYVGPHRNGAFAVLERMGASIHYTWRGPQAADITIKSSDLHATEIFGAEIPSLIDELPVLSLAAACAAGVTEVRDAEEMRVKESDRIASVVREIGGLGPSMRERTDGFVVEGDAMFQGGKVQAHLDHRIAMTGAIAALVSASPVTVEGWETVHSSYPSFLEDLASLRT